MADIIITTDKPLLPVTSEGTTEYGELNYIFYPGISEYRKVYLRNTTGTNKNVVVKFKAHQTEPNWFRTLRISETNSGVLTAGTLDNQWSGTVNASSTKTLYVYSECTKEGYSQQYTGTYWTNSGFAIADLNLINDKDNVSVAIDCDAANAGSTLKLDLGVGMAEEFVRVKFDVTGAVNATLNIQYSDDNTNWTTVYTGADLSICTDVKQMTLWWNKPGAHRYWRIYKTNAATAGADITEVQWLLFEAHKDAYDFGVYGDKKSFMYDVNGNFDDYELRTSVIINVDVFARQSFTKPRGRVGPKTLTAVENLEKYGTSIQMWYVPTMTFTYNLNTKSDYQLEQRVWNTKAIITPAKRDLRYTAAADGLAPSMYRYDQRRILFSPYGPDYVGWYMPNYDFWHQYGHSYYVIWDNKCYKVDDPQPVYIDDEIVAISARFFLQSDMVNLSTDPRNYVVANRDGVFTEFPNDIYPYVIGIFDPNTPEQRAMRWAGAYPSYVYDRGFKRRPNTYSLTPVLESAGVFNGEAYLTETWWNPAGNGFQTAQPVAFGARVKAGTGNAKYFQIPRFYNWIGYVDANDLYDVINHLVQVYYDEDCTIPVKINVTGSIFAKVEYAFDTANVTAAGLVTLTALGNTVTTDGHTVRTPMKLYVRYRREDGDTLYHYPA